MHAHIFIDFIHDQSHKRIICNLPYISDSRDATLAKLIKYEVPYLAFIQQVAIHWVLCQATIQIENYSICYRTWLIDSRWAILEDKSKTRYSGWPLNKNMVLLRGSSGKCALYSSSLQENKTTYSLFTFPHASLSPAGWSILHPSVKALIQLHLSL